MSPRHLNRGVSSRIQIQLSFIDNCVAPTFAALTKAFPSLKFLSDRVSANRAALAQLSDQELVVKANGRGHIDHNYGSELLTPPPQIYAHTLQKDAMRASGSAQTKRIEAKDHSDRGEFIAAVGGGLGGEVDGGGAEEDQLAPQPPARKRRERPKLDGGVRKERKKRIEAKRREPKSKRSQRLIDGQGVKLTD
jgi:hypothetical protein